MSKLQNNKKLLAENQLLREQRLHSRAEKELRKMCEQTLMIDDADDVHCMKAKARAILEELKVGGNE